MSRSDACFISVRIFVGYEVIVGFKGLRGRTLPSIDPGSESFIAVDVSRAIVGSGRGIDYEVIVWFKVLGSFNPVIDPESFVAVDASRAIVGCRELRTMKSLSDP